MENNGGVRIFGVEMHLVEEPNDVVPESDSGSRSDAGDGTSSDAFTNGRLVRVEEGSSQEKYVKTDFLKAMSGVGLETAAETVYTNLYRGVTWQARLHSFLELCRNQPGPDKVKHAWFGGSKEEIGNVLRYGFASRGRGITLSPYDNPTVSLRACVADEDGLYHMIFCRAILGKPELLRPGAIQQFATSEDCYAGVDNLASPNVYLVWSSYMNTHVTPMYVVSFKPPVKAAQGPARAPVAVNPVSPIIRDFYVEGVDKLIDELASVLPASTITTLRKLNGDLEERNITKAEMRQNLRQLVGVDVLRTAMDSVIREFGSDENTQGPVGASSRAPVAVNPVDPAPRSMSFGVLIHQLILEVAWALPASTITRLQKVSGDYREKKITKQVMLQKLKQIAGADVLKTALWSLKRKRDMKNNDANGARRAAWARSSASKVVKKLRGARSP